MVGRYYFYKDVVPFCAMVTIECTNVGVNILFKAATLKGLSYYVFIVYSYAISTLVILLPLPFVFRRSTGLPAFKVSLLFKIFLLGVLGFVLQVCGYKGIEYSSPTLSSAMSNLIPAFTFILAVFFRMEKANLRSSSSQAKIMGSIVSITGAIIVVLYKGPVILSASSPSQSASTYSLPGSPSQGNWALGALLIAVGNLLVSCWFIGQTHVMKQYPVELVVVLLYYLCGTLISAPVCLLAEASLSSWKLNPDITLVSVIYAGLCSCLSTLVHTWGLHLKGPVYITIFKPLSIVIAAAMSAIFLGDALHLGSVFGAVILSIGFYAVIWGKTKGEELGEEDCCLGRTLPPCNSRTPLLQWQDNRKITYDACQ